MLQPIKTFICYAHEDREVVDRLKSHLATLKNKKKHLLQIWSDGKILAGEPWDKSIKTQLEQAELILLLVSVDFMRSEYIQEKELKTALRRNRNGQVILIPIIVSSCDWEEHFNIGQFQALPTQARPILSSHFPHREEAYHDIAIGVKKRAEDILDQQKAAEALIKAEAAARKKEAAKTARLADEAEAERQRTKTENKLKRLNDEAAWKGCSEQNTIKAYEAYLLNEDHKRHKAEARQRIIDLGAEDIKRKMATKFSIGRYTFDHKNLSLTTEGYSENLTQMEADLLKLFNDNRNQVLNHSDIHEAIWGKGDDKAAGTLRVFITRLRKYLKLDDRIEIENLHGVGFKFRVDE